MIIKYMKDIQRFPTKPGIWAYLYPARTTMWMSIGFFIIAIVSWLAESLLPLFIERILTAVRSDDMHLLKMTVGALSIFGWVTLINGWLWHRYFWWTLFVRWDAAIQSQILSWYRSVSHDSILRYGVTQLYSVVRMGSEKWVSFSFFLINRVTSVTISIISSIVLLVVLLPLIWWLGVVLIFLLFGVVAHWFHRSLQPLRAQRYALEQDMQNTLLRSFLLPWSLLRRSALESVQSEIHRAGELIYSLKKKEGVHAFVMFDFVYSLSNCVRIALVLSVLYAWWVLSDPIVELPVLFLILSQLTFSINWLMDMAWEYGGIKTWVDKMLEVFALLPLAPNLDHGSVYRPWDGAIELRKVTFGYSEQKPTLHDISLKIEWWEHIALVWPSGAGKTTIARLAMSYLLPTSWSVMIDGQDTRTLDISSLVDSIWYLQQEPQIFDASIRDNLVYGIDREVGESEMIQALRDAAADFVIDDLPDALQTIIGENWLLLSGGERQRIAIAKLFLQSPRIIILDEPTAALDSLSEARVTEALHRLSRGRTLITIAHRLQTVREADRIVVIRDGCIEAVGSHDDLLASSELYASMVDLQTGRVRG